MTLICWDGRTVAADGLYSYGDMRASGSLPKLRKVGSHVFGLTGTTALFDPMVEWFFGSRKPEDMPNAGEKHENTRLLVFEAGGCVSYKISLPYPEPCFAPDAWGCCAEYAIGCLDAGASPERTVELAIARNQDLGGPVQVIDLLSLKAEAA